MKTTISNKCKAYTSLEQSKKLAEILPIESADMFIADVSLKEEQTHSYNFHVLTTWGHKNFDELKERENKFVQFIPCWSLGALFGVLPTTIGNFFENNALRLRIDKGENDFNIWYENFDCGDVAEGLDVKEDNLVDACYEMLLKLYKQKLL